MSGPSAPLRPWVWLGIPALMAMAATLVAAIPLRFLGLRLPEPVIPMVLAFAWPIIRPSLLGPFALLLVGLFLDLFWNGPLGFWAFALLSVYSITFLIRNLIAGQAVRVLFACYGGLSLAVFLMAYLRLAIRSDAPPDLVPITINAICTLALFPIAHHLIERFEDADIRFR